MSKIEDLSQPILKRSNLTDTSIQALTTGYEYFQEKYNNFRNFIHGPSMMHPEAVAVSQYLNILPLEEFREMIFPKLMNAIMYHDDGNDSKRNLECERVICELMVENNFHINMLSKPDKDKLIRYTILFCVLMSNTD